MAYTPPTISDLKARFPEFASVADALLTLVLDEAIAEVGDSWIEKDRKTATLHLAAHLLASQGHGGGGGSAASGPVKRRKVGDVEVEFATPTGSAGGQSGFDSSAYGQRFLELKRRNFPTVRVV